MSLLGTAVFYTCTSRPLHGQLLDDPVNIEHTDLLLFTREVKRSPLQLFFTQLGISIEHTHTHLLGLFKNLLARSCRNSMRNLCSMRLVVHEESLELMDIGYPVLEEAAGEHKASLLVRTIADRHHRSLASVLMAHRRVYPAGLPPRWLDADEAFGLEADELVLPLLDNDLVREGMDRLAGHSFQIMGFFAANNFNLN